MEINEKDIDIDFAQKKKVALVFISLNNRYWPYLTQVVKDCRQNFLPHHKVDYFAWTDFGTEGKEKELASIATLFENAQKGQEGVNRFLEVFAVIIRLYELFYPQKIQDAVAELRNQGIEFKRDGGKFWVEATHEMTAVDLAIFYQTAKSILVLAQADMDATLKDVTLIETEPIEWPAPTLMRYHLFLQQEEKLKDYDYVFYMDADMRVVAKISDEIFGDGLTAAEHPMYSLRKQYIPPYEPNKASTAYIPRPGKVIDENGKPRFKPYYYAGGFQGGVAKDFIEAMKVMKKNIDKDFDNNYTAIWNDESHWNRYLSEHEPAIVLSPAYIYPDSLIKEYYEPLWGCSYEPKIVTLTKPFSLSTEGGKELNQFLGKDVAAAATVTCPTCKDPLSVQGHRIQKVLQCQGSGKPHQLEMIKI